MNKHDDDIREFFNEMRAFDNQHSIPPFEDVVRRPSRKQYYLIPAGIAATVILFFGVYIVNLLNTPENTQENVTIIVDIESTPNESILTQGTSLYAWDAPSNSLINEF